MCIVRKALLFVLCFCTLIISVDAGSSIYIAQDNGYVGVYDAVTGALQNDKFADVRGINTGTFAMDQNHLYVTDYSNSRVMEFNAKTGQLENPTLINVYPYVWGIAVDNAGHLFAASYPPEGYNSTVGKYLVSGTTATTIDAGFIHSNSIEDIALDGLGNLYTGGYYTLAKWDATTGVLEAATSSNGFKEGLAIYPNNGYSVFAQYYGNAAYEFTSSLDYAGRQVLPATGTASGGLGVLDDTLYLATGGHIETFDLLTNSYTSTNFLQTTMAIGNHFVIGQGYDAAAVPEPGAFCLVAAGVVCCGFFTWNRRRAAK